MHRRNLTYKHSVKIGRRIHLLYQRLIDKASRINILGIQLLTLHHHTGLGKSNTTAMRHRRKPSLGYLIAIAPRHRATQIERMAIALSKKAERKRIVRLNKLKRMTLRTNENKATGLFHNIPKPPHEAVMVL